MRRMLFCLLPCPNTRYCPGLLRGFRRAFQECLPASATGRCCKEAIKSEHQLFFRRVVFVQSGLLAQGVINPGTSSPFMLTLSAAHSFGVPTRAIDALDNLPRRYWAVCRCEVLTVAPEIFLRVIEIDPNWNEELNRYALRRAFCERLGLMVCQAAAPEQGGRTGGNDSL